MPVIAHLGKCTSNRNDGQPVMCREVFVVFTVFLLGKKDFFGGEVCLVFGLFMF